ASDLVGEGGHAARGALADARHRAGRSRRARHCGRTDRRGIRGVRGARVVPLVVCATPIGNLEDVTLRVLAELAAADVVLCEDTRHTRVLLERHGIKARLLSYHEHNEAKRTTELLPRLEAGERVALVSDAGLPGVAFESPQRLPATLRSLAATDAEREVAVCRELTKRFEEVARGTAAELAERFAAPPKGEITLVLGSGSASVEGDAAPALAAVA